MDFFLLLALILVAAQLVSRQQRQRIALLGSALKPYQIERLMESLIEGYLRAMGEKGDERRQQSLDFLHISETQLAEQFERFAADFQRQPEAQTRVSRLPLALPLAAQLFPQAGFDMRRILAVHARGIARAAHNDGALSPRDKAFTMTAELLLMQHSCHWYCKSKTVASARVFARHQTTYAQILDAVSPETRHDYLALVKG